METVQMPKFEIEIRNSKMETGNWECGFESPLGMLDARRNGGKAQNEANEAKNVKK